MKIILEIISLQVLKMKYKEQQVYLWWKQRKRQASVLGGGGGSGDVCKVYPNLWELLGCDSVMIFQLEVTLVSK